jgi:hypothetical protein
MNSDKSGLLFPRRSHKVGLMTRSLERISILFLFTFALHASPLTWDLENIQVIGPSFVGGALTGSFQFDFTTNAYSNVDVTLWDFYTPPLPPIAPQQLVIFDAATDESTASQMDLYSTSYPSSFNLSLSFTEPLGDQTIDPLTPGVAGLVEIFNGNSTTTLFVLGTGEFGVAYAEQAQGTTGPPYQGAPEPATWFMTLMCVFAGLWRFGALRHRRRHL